MEDKTVVQLLAIVVFMYASYRLFTTPHQLNSKNHSLRTVAILVLGDVGRSPRMMYHAESFANNDFDTFLIGYQGSKPIPSLLSLPHVHFLYLSQPPKGLTSSLPFILSVPLKIAHQITTVLSALLLRIPNPPEFILVQNPPSIPTLALVALVGWLRGSKIIIDWHNLGYSILALKLGPGHVLVRIAKKFESTFGRSAYAHLFVTNAMHDRLIEEWDLQGHKAILHDRPPAHFRPAQGPEMHELFLRLLKSPPFLFLTPFFPPHTPPYSTPFTAEIAANTHAPASPTIPTSTSSSAPTIQPPATDAPTASPSSSTPYPHLIPSQPRRNRPALLVSSTSWTPDEDFGMLLEALGIYDARARAMNYRAHDNNNNNEPGVVTPLPKVLMVVTGKGPLKERYMREVEALQDGWQWVRCISLWLEAEDYPVLLGSADLGICLHSSSSALDLPMKIVDMFGCGLPVCALDFACLNELVKQNVNGLTFTSARELAQHLESLLSSFPDPRGPLNRLRRSLAASTSSASARVGDATRGDIGQAIDSEGGVAWEWNSWSDNWNKVVRPLVSKDTNGYHDEWIM